MSRSAYSSIDNARGRSGCTFVLERFLPWLVGDIVPFGDLVTSVLLWCTLPQTKPDDFECSEVRYKSIRNVLLGGTVVSAIPEAAILFGMIIGLTGVVVGGLAFLAHRQDGDHIVGIMRDLARYSRYALADGKATVDFLVHRTGFGSRGGPPLGWQHTVEFVVSVTMMLAHAPLYIPVYCGCCWFVKREERTFVMFIVVQVIAGVTTTAASIFFWCVSGESMAIISSSFGLYSLLVGTVVAAKKSGMESHDYGSIQATP